MSVLTSLISDIPLSKEIEEGKMKWKRHRMGKTEEGKGDKALT